MVDIIGLNMVSSDPIAERAAKVRAYEEILHSRTLSRSEQLVQFLRFICELEIDGRGAEITEYSIATSALNRPAAYAPGEDSSVRSRAHTLRRKLKEYYETEAPHAELRVELPKGSYRPQFIRRQDLPSSSGDSPEPAGELRQTGRKLTLAWAILVSSILLAGAALLATRPVATDLIDPILREAWGPVLQAGNDVLILVGAPPVVRAIPSQPGMKPLGNILEPAAPWISQWYKSLNLDDRGGPVYTFPTRGYSVFCDSIAAMAATSLIGAAGASYHAVPELSVRPMAIHENGLLVIGAPAYTAYAARVLKSTPYSIWFDPERNDEILGERMAANQHVYQARRAPQTARYTSVYGLITVLPSQPGRPRPERTLIFSGIMGSPGAQAALEFFRSPASLRDLQKRFRQQGYSHFPPAYQVVVRCGVDAETAINAVYEDHRVMSTVPVIE